MRLNLRYEAIFGENRDIFAGASVLDLASHDGRWSLAALATGARSVVGIEARPELVKSAMENLAGYGYRADRARFVTGDVHDVLSTHDLGADVVLCLGFLYHTLRYNAGAVVAPGGQVFSVMAFTVTNGQIAQIDVLADPERIERLNLGLP